MADVGQEMVKNLYKEMMVDERWAVRTERGFTWWGYRHAQHVEASLPVRSAGFDVCSVRIWTDVARDVNPASNPAVAITPVNFQQTLNALVWNSGDRTISECCTAIVHKENVGWLGKILAVAALLQNVAAHNRAQEIADACGGEPAASNHPTSGQRAAMAEILNVPDQVVLPVGREPSRFAGPFSEGLGDFAASMGWVGFSSAHGMTCEVPYTGSRPAALRKNDDPEAAVETALVRIFTEHPHPEAGNGALVVMQLPVAPGVDAAPLLANQLNVVEAAGHLSAPLLGAWCPDVFSKDGNGLAFCCFLPNLIARPGLLENLIVYQAARAQFALRQLLLRRRPEVSHR